MQYEQLNKRNPRQFIAPIVTFRRIWGATRGTEPKKLFLHVALIVPALILAQVAHSEAHNYRKMNNEAFGIFVKHETSRDNLTVFTQEKIKVTGTVSDAHGVPIAGVSVRVKGTTSAVATDENGNYEIELNKGQTLTFNNIGFASKEIIVNAAGTQNIKLDSRSEDISEAVVIGYGSQQRKDVTGSIATVPMRNVRGQAIASPDQALTGQLSGVQVSNSNGTPGGGPRIQIRGIGAIGAGSQPLYVIDGFPVPSSSSERNNPMATINPNDIESMTVLKDASATAIYGSRGSNGVILINTKRGTDGKMRIGVAASSGLQQVPQKGRPNLMNAAEFAQFRKEAIEDKIRFEQGREPTLNDIPEEYRNPASLGKGVDWYDAVTRVAPMSDINVNFSGGNESVRSFVSAGYLNQKGVMLNSGFDRFSIRANVEGNFLKKLKLGMNINPTLSYLKGGINGQGRDEFFEITTPVAKIYNDDGSYVPFIQSAGTFGNPNPVMYLNQRTNKSSKLRLLMSTYAEYSILENLKFKTTFNVDYLDQSVETFRPSTIPNQNAPGPSIPSGSYGRDQYINWANENTLNYNYTSDNGHAISALAGYSIQMQKNKTADFNGTQFPDDDIQTLNAAARITGGTGIEDWGLISYLARVNYAYLDRYILTGSFRADGSSRFGNDNRWGSFPSVAIAWRLSEEGFLKDKEWINELKLRASYGRSGNFNIPNYAALSSIGASNYIFGGVLAPGRTMNSLGNSFLGWERMKELNIGLDFTTWNNRLTLTANYYKRNTLDLLLNTPIPNSSGFGSVVENRGDVENKGFEFSISSANIAREKFTWNTDFNISFNRNKVIALGRSKDPIYSGQSSEGNFTNITQIGKPVGMIIGYVVEGIYQNQAEIDNSPAFPGAIPGNLKMRDVNGDGQITPNDDFAVIGNPYPDFTFGMTNTLTYKAFDFRMMMVGAMGQEMLLATRFYTDNIDGVFNVRKEVANRWRSESNPGNGRVPTTNGTGRGRVMYRDVNSLFVQKADYLWIKNITIGYTLPKSIGGVLNNLRVYANLQNPFLFTKYEGNPESTNVNRPDGSPLTPGIDYSAYPVPKIYSFGLNFNF